MLLRKQTIPDHASFSPGKVIVTGEHSVVYGQPAVVAALDVGVYCWVSNDHRLEEYSDPLENYLEKILTILTKRYLFDISVKQINIISEIPSGVGLGSSAAYAHAVVLAVCKFHNTDLTKEVTYDLVLEAEKYIHSNPSGVDPSAVVFGCTQLFQKESETKTYTQKRLQLPQPYSFLLVNSGTASETTGQMVQLVAKKISDLHDLKKVVQEIGTVTKQIVISLESGTLSGELLKKNNKLLVRLGIVGKKAQDLMSAIEDLGYSTKISGAGGVLTGSGMILCYEKSENYIELENYCKANSLEYIKSTIK